MLSSFFLKKIQVSFHNTYTDIWEYKKAFIEGSIHFSRVIGPKCPICGKTDEYIQIKEYYRYAIDLFPFKKELVPIARFLCNTTHRTFSLLPHQLIPYCQYTLISITRTLFLVNKYQQAGYRGFYHAVNELSPDSDVTPWLINRWWIVFLKGFERAHHILSARFALWDIRSRGGGKKEINRVWEYLKIVAKDSSSPLAEDVLSVAIWYYSQTKSHLFGTSSLQRSIKNK